ncbi:hypothetical protein A2533_00825 [Candidatus Falkowbacteria bacterium RIFOXYD2_FULL_35_9]|uniref:EF-hand domain-containing protein n=1 Tax=Candidatus Falkowbacteria bacterium RIFOXYC2_FULL_36_12 TaxID=1798002 RepID=A0A1F5SZF9_9BACT|nr:MAG: hypothetical protein A2300_00165 [Candidatus Falkowbacteria bacterium RIFOXYB2_FULL_35_7]OGF31876.1 MAG: hypothetical protein A2478_05330 [Candidatus Falkowbacteria bacterium RIFOXYC2_FULL_36_12]OGF33985.1 MAG: hypothetical protein A2223_00745 [Candidatus Falkowbacteria bacterium RIFOXYA2_FULL_35_8]OGF45820.1 MAG: hypothetical protein A2533_00825 [Candidatus Falkowbacteria bacterium RIFOXYD2_FULL_35_9]
MVQTKTEKQNSPDTIHVMPLEFYGVNPEEKQTKIETRIVEKIVTKPGKPFPKKRNKAMTVVVVFSLLIIICLLSYLVYLNYADTTSNSTIIEVPVVENPKPIVDIPIVEQPDEPVVPIIPIVPVMIKLADIHDADADADGLTDAEELLINTDMNKPDTDADSYLDGDELLNLYTPLEVGEKLEFSDLVATFVNPNYDYDVFYPKAWFARAVERDNREVVFTSPTGEFVNILVVQNESLQDLKQWYLSQDSEADIAQLVDFDNKQGVKGIISPDGFRYYFSKANQVYVVSYNIGLKQKASYPNLFALIAQSFIFTE